jgi:hypothetical protein
MTLEQIYCAEARVEELRQVHAAAAEKLDTARLAFR